MPSNMERPLRTLLRTTLTALATAGLLLAAAAPTQGQATDHLRSLQAGMDTGFGPSAAIPDALLGLSAFHFPRALAFSSQRWGVFLDWKMTHTNLEGDENYRDDLGVEDAEFLNHQRVADENQWLLFNAGVIRPLSPELALVAGAGVGRRTAIREYFDRTQEYSETGTYFVGIPEASGWEAQGVAGILLRAGPNLILRLGYETGPGGVSVGGYLVLR